MVNDAPDKKSGSTFGERFAFARWWQAGHLRDESDSDFATAVGRDKATVSGWRRLIKPPPADACRAIADRTGVDAGWLTHGELSQAPEPDEFRQWLDVQRRSHTPIIPLHGRPVADVIAKRDKKGAAKPGPRKGKGR
jgi:transcriptional regulator with XRE-family HTH domain